MPAFFEDPPAELSFCPGLCYDTRTASAKGEDGTILSAQKTDTRGDGIRCASPDMLSDGKWWQWIYVGCQLVDTIKFNTGTGKV